VRDKGKNKCYYLMFSFSRISGSNKTFASYPIFYLIICYLFLKVESMFDKNKILYRFFNDDDFLRISESIKEAESKTAGEIKISIKEKRDFSQKKKSLIELASLEFARLGMNNTRDKTGILLFLLLNEKKFYILADEGINKKVEQKVWNEIRDRMQADFSRGHFTKGILLGINEVGKILASHFPIKPDDVNELSDKVEIN
jgi:uncharacterized membrane protein